MAQESLPRTLISSDPPSPDPIAAISRTSSFTRLNAKAPEFVPSPRPLPQRAPPPAAIHSLHVPAQHQHQFHQPFAVQYHNPSQHQNHQGGNQQYQKQQHRDQASGEHDHGGSTKNGLSDEAIQKTLNQVEYYFSDINLATTDHLMRFINKDPEGYVPISVVASFKKIRALISGHSQLASILRNSSKLAVSEDGKKVRRLHPFNDSDMEELQSRVVIAENLPEDHCHQKLMKLFSSVGSVKAIRTCQPQASNSGASASRPGKGDGMLSSKLHAFVEYESVELAEKAVEELNDEENWRSGLRVRLMLRLGSKPVHARGRRSHEGEAHGEEEDVIASEQQSEKQLVDVIEQPDGHLHGQRPGEETVNEKDGVQRKGRGSGRGRGRGRGQYHYHNNHNHHNNRGGTSNNNPGGNVGTSEVTAVPKQQPPGPRMPDGTRGFTMGRGKPIAVNTV